MSFPQRLGSFTRLAREERMLALRALTWIVIVRAALSLFSLARVRAMARGRLRVTAPLRPGWPALVRRAVLRASRSLPGTTCLAQSLVAERLLRLKGCDALFSIGVAHAPRDEPPLGVRRASLDAHAWVEYDGFLVTGEDPHRRYTRVSAPRHA